MEATSQPRAFQSRGGGPADHSRSRGGAIHRNKHWTGEGGTSRASTASPRLPDGEHWETNAERRPGGEPYRGRGAGRGRGFRGTPRIYHNATLRVPRQARETSHDPETEPDELEEETSEVDIPEVQVPAPVVNRETTLTKAREGERARAISEGKMDDPKAPKRLEDAINVVGTCMEMCPAYEKHRRDLQGPVDPWERLPNSRRMDFTRAVKMYQRAPGDTALPSDIRPPEVLKTTLDYLFHTLIPTSGFPETISFVRDRARAVRTDFTLQHENGSLAMECHDRCVRMHILALHIMRETPDYPMHLEDQQLANCLQSLKEFYDEQRGQYESPNELEMWVYNRLIHIRDQKERNENIPTHLQEHPVFKHVSRFRSHVQLASQPITKTSALVVDDAAMQIFGELAQELRAQGSGVMMYLTACLLEKLFGSDRIEDIESLRGDLTIPEIIDGVSTHSQAEGHEETEYEGEYYEEEHHVDGEQNRQEGEEEYYEEDKGDEESQLPEREKSFLSTASEETTASSTPAAPTPIFAPTPSPFGAPTPSPFGSGQSAFGGGAGVGVNLGAFAGMKTSAFGGAKPASAFGKPPPVSAFGQTPPVSAFGKPLTFSSPPPSASPPTPKGIFSTPLFGPKPTTPSVVSPPSSLPPVNALSPSAPKPPSIFQHSFPSRGNAAPKQSLADALPLPDLPSSTSKPSSLFGHSFPLREEAAPKRSLADAPPLPDLSSSAPKPSSLFGHSFPARGEAAISKPGLADTPPLPDVSSPSLNPAAPAFLPSVAPTAGPSPPTLKVNGFGHKTSTFQPSPLGAKPPIFADPVSPVSPAELVADSNINGRRRAPSTTTSLPKLDTMSSGLRTPRFSSPAPGSPTLPPLMPKTQPISLPPSTPPPLSPDKGHRPRLLDLKQIAGPSNAEILSPLVLASPSQSRPPPQSRLPSFSIPTPAQPVLSIGFVDKGKGKASEDLESKADGFQKRGALVKGTLRVWRQRATDRAAWIEACKHSDAYKQKAQRERESPSNDRKRPRTTSALVPMERKRSKRRQTNEFEFMNSPRTDEALVNRLKNNAAEHERRWAPGSFLNVMRKHAPRKNGVMPEEWCIWLSLNPETDATAIWLERKFDVPASGRWASDAVYSIPLAGSDGDEAESPGVLVFECTPLENFPQELERKIRILEDCTRLRDIIQALPSRRRYVPSILVIHWDDGTPLDPNSELTAMIAKMVVDEHFKVPPPLNDCHYEGPRRETEETLKVLPLDFVGKLSQTLTLNGVFKLFDSAWENFASEWIEPSAVNGEVDWKMYGRVLDATVEILNAEAQLVVDAVSPAIVSNSGTTVVRSFKALPPLDTRGVSDSNSMHNTAIAWLTSSVLRTIASGLVRDIQSQRDMGRDFTAVMFAKALLEITIWRTETVVRSDSRTKYHIPKTEVVDMADRFEAVVQTQGTKLRHAYTMRAQTHRSPPKRRMSLVDGETSRSPTPAKRQRSDTSESSRPSIPSFSRSQSGASAPPSPSTNGGDKSNASLTSISVAMLRALTKDVKKKYSTST